MIPVCIKCYENSNIFLRYFIIPGDLIFNNEYYTCKSHNEEFFDMKFVLHNSKKYLLKLKPTDYILKKLEYISMITKFYKCYL